MRTFKDVKGCDEAKAELEEVVEYLKNPSKFTRLGGKLPKGILLTGPPGTGKTLLARATAGEAGVPFFYRAGSEFEEMFVGVGWRRVRSLFSAAKKKGPCIIFIDEIDAVGGCRKRWESHTRKTLNQLLVEMDGFEENQGIIVMAATNLPETLDPALTRPGRFDRHVAVDIPDYKGRKEILELYMKDKPIASDVDAAAIARGSVGFSGADLYNLLNTAACAAAKDGKDSIDALTNDASKDKILMGAERKSMLLSEESKKLTAYHESGHAIVALYTDAALPVQKATIMPRGRALGMVTQIPEKDETSISKEQLLAKLDVCMGGRVAEELIFGDNKVTTGARSDLQQATSLARHMVAECGMSEAIGPIYVDDLRGQSAQMRSAIDAEVTGMLKGRGGEGEGPAQGEGQGAQAPCRGADGEGDPGPGADQVGAGDQEGGGEEGGEGGRGRGRGSAARRETVSLTYYKLEKKKEKRGGSSWADHAKKRSLLCLGLSNPMSSSMSCAMRTRDKVLRECLTVKYSFFVIPSAGLCQCSTHLKYLFSRGSFFNSCKILSSSTPGATVLKRHRVIKIFSKFRYSLSLTPGGLEV